MIAPCLRHLRFASVGAEVRPPDAQRPAIIPRIRNPAPCFRKWLPARSGERLLQRHRRAGAFSKKKSPPERARRGGDFYKKNFVWMSSDDLFL